MARSKVVNAVKKTPRTRKSQTDLAAALPSAEAIDAALVGQAVAGLNHLYSAKGIETARSAAECVIQVIFGGNVEVFRARHGTHMSFNELGRLDDLQVSYQFIWNSCAVVDQLRMLSPEIADALPMSHHKLLQVKDEARKNSLAKAAVKDGLSKRDFEERVTEVRAEQKAVCEAGRPPLPEFVKAVTIWRRAAALARREAVTASSFAQIPVHEARSLRCELETCIADFSQIAMLPREHVNM